MVNCNSVSNMALEGEIRPDPALCLDEARLNGGQLPLTALIETFYARLQARGCGRLDNSALYRLLSNA